MHDISIKQFYKNPAIYFKSIKNVFFQYYLTYDYIFTHKSSYR